MTSTESSLLPPPITEPLSMLTSLKLRSTATRMCWSWTSRSFVGSMSIHPKPGMKTETHAWEASAPSRRG